MRLQTLFPSWQFAEDLLITNLALDSREVKPEGMFFAYPGTETDGRNYIAAAVANGARVIVYEDGDQFTPPQLSSDIIVIPQSGLKNKVGKIAAKFYHQPSRSLNITGVTGTNGKTSITHFISQAFAKQHVSCAVMGTVGNGLLSDLQDATHTTSDPIHLQWQLREFNQEGISHVAMEVSSHALDQGRVAGTRFTTAVYSQLSQDHLDYHKTMRAYAEAKALLFQQPGLQYAVINTDDKFGCELIESYGSTLDVVTYSTERNRYPNFNAIVAKEARSTVDGFVIKVETSWGNAELPCHLYGSFNVSNVLATLGVLLVNGIAFEDAIESCRLMQSVNGRMQQFKYKDKPVVVVDYAHTPDALQKTLETLRKHCEGRLWCVFGCGGDRDRAKRPLMAQAAEQVADNLIITNDNPRKEVPEAIAKDIVAGLKSATSHDVILDRRGAIVKAVQSASVNDIVLVAGKGHETYQIMDDQVLPFSDAEVVEHALKNY